MKSMLLVAALILAIPISGLALSDETKATIRAAAAVGRVINSGEVPPGVAVGVVKGLRRDRVANAEIGNLFRAMLGVEVGGAEKSQGMGRFVQDAHARGLYGQSLATAIHQEQARRGIQNSGSDAIIIDLRTHPGQGGNKSPGPPSNPGSRGQGKGRGR